MSDGMVVPLMADLQAAGPAALPLEMAIAEGDCPRDEVDNDEVGDVDAVDERLAATLNRDPDLWLYRRRTLSLLRRYMRFSVEAGRLPSLLGRELFRTRITRYRVATFEDTVIFVHDVERALGQLDKFELEMIATLVMQDYTQDEASRLMKCGRRTIGRRFPEILDRLSEIFLQGDILAPLVFRNSGSQKSCQEAENREIFASDSEERK